MDIKELKLKIPHGYCKVIAAKAGVSQTSVSKFLNGKFKSQKIESAILETLADLSNHKKDLLSQIL